MRRRLVLTLATLASACGGEPSGFEHFFHVDEAPDAIRDVASAVVRISATHPLGRSNGTGFFLDRSNLLVTNEHVVGAENCPREGCQVTLFVNLQRGGAYRSLDVRLTPFLGSAGLDVTMYEVAPAGDVRVGTPLPSPILSSEVRRAEELHVVGHPLGGLKKWSTGRVLESDGEFLELDALAQPGSSGSPLVDGEGHLLGILHRGIEELGRGEPLVLAIATWADAFVARLDTPEEERLAIFDVLDRPRTPEALARDEPMFFAAQTSRVQVEGAEGTTLRPFLEVMAELCDRTLQTWDPANAFRGAEGLFEHCVRPTRWLACGMGTEPHQTCQNVMEWKARIDAATILLADVSYDLTRFSENFQRRFDRGLERKSLVESLALSSFNPELSHTPRAAKIRLARQLIAGMSLVGSDVSLILDYRDGAAYERFLVDVLDGLFVLTDAGRLDAEALKIRVKDLLDEPLIDFDQYTQIELTAFLAGLGDVL